MDSIQEANVVALFVQAILYGFYLVTVPLTLFDDTEWKRRGNINWIMLSTIILFFLFSTLDLFLSLWMGIVAMRGQTMAYNRYGTVNNIIENTTIMIADAVLIYRCWIVYAKSWRMIFMPFLTWLAALSCFVLVICSQLSVTWESWFYHFWVGFYSSNIFTNVYATAAIIFRILVAANYTSHQQSSSRSRLYQASRIVFESGSLYTLTSCMNLISSIVGGPPITRYILDAVNFSMTGITFNLIIIRVYRNRSNYDTDTLDSIASPHLSGSKSPSHTSELSTTTTATSNQESYIEVQNRANTPLLECGANEIWRDLTYTSSKDTIYSANPITADHSYSWTH